MTRIPLIVDTLTISNTDTISNKKFMHYSEVDRCDAQDCSDVYISLGSSAGFL
jgi:hypothetical protein